MNDNMNNKESEQNGGTANPSTESKQDQLLNKAKETAAHAKDLAQQGINAAKLKFEESGGVDGLKTKGKGFLDEIKAKFVPDDGAKGVKGFISRVKNLWISGKVGKITVTGVAVLLLVLLSNIGDSSGGASTSTGLSKKHGVIIKGFYIGMPLTDALDLVNGKYSDVFTKFSIPKDYMADGYPKPSGEGKIMWTHPLVGERIEVDGVTFDKCFIYDNKIINGEEAQFIGDENGNLQSLRFPKSVVDPLFNVPDMSVEDFAQAFVDSYGIPEMKPEAQGGRSYWSYTSPNGYKVAISDKKAVMLVKVASAAERKLD